MKELRGAHICRRGFCVTLQRRMSYYVSEGDDVAMYENVKIGIIAAICAKLHWHAASQIWDLKLRYGVGA